MKTTFYILSVSCLPFLSTAQIVYTAINPDSLVTAQYVLDLNNDGTPEFRIEKIIDSGVNVVQAIGLTSQDSMAGYYAGFPAVTGYSYALSSDEIIGSNTNLVNEGIMGGDHPLIMEDAEWPDGSNRYLGLKFNISGEAHYGWTKIEIATDYVAFTIKEYAYNATPGAIINSGITSVEDPSTMLRATLTAYPNPCQESATFSFSLCDEAEHELNVYDLSGKLIFSEAKGKAKPGKQVLQFNVSQWNAGIYFCRIVTGANSATYKLSVIR